MKESDAYYNICNIKQKHKLIYYIMTTILDGGMGHELKLRGVSDGTFVAGLLANENNCSIVESIYEDYLDAGCDVITTNSFVAVPQRMTECGLATDEDSANIRASQLIKASVDRAKAAIAKYYDKHNTGEENKCNNKKLIAGCIPPLSECYFANKVSTNIDTMISEYTVIITTLLECNVDILLAETLSTAREAIAILRSLSANVQQKMPPIWISFTIHDDRPTALRSDELLEDACQSIIQEANKLQLPLAAVGVNCSAPYAISNALPILTNITEGTNIKVSAYGNCFQTTTSEWINSLDDDAKCCDDTTSEEMTKTKLDSHDYDDEGYLLPDSYAKFVVEWAKSAPIIGGCCGSRPNHLCKVSAAIKMIPSLANSLTK